MRRPILTAATGGIMCLALANAVGATGQTEILLHSGVASPDGNGMIQEMFWGPILNDLGQVAFSAVVGESPDASETAIIWARDEGTEVVSRGQGPLFFTLNNTGQLAFDSSEYAIYLHDGSTVRTVVKNGDPTPDGLGVIERVHKRGPRLNDFGQVSFFAETTVSDGAFPEEILYQTVNGVPVEVLRPSRDLPLDQFGRSSFWTLDFQSNNAVGHLVWASTSTAYDHIFTVSADGTVATAYDGTVPLRDGTRGEGGYPHYAFSDSGDAAFSTRYQRPDGVWATGMFRLHDGEVRPVLLDGDVAPDGVSTVTGAGGLMAMNAGGEILFSARFAPPDGGFAPDVILVSDGDDLRQIAQNNDEMPAAQGVLFPVISSPPALNDKGQALFKGTIFSDVPELSHRSALILYDKRLGLLEVTPSDQLIDGKKINRFATWPPQPGFVEGDSLNESGQVAYLYVLDDGTEGVALWTPPDPIGGDANLDGVVSLADFLILRANFGQSGDHIYFQQADFNDDDAVSLADFLILRQNFGHASPGDVAEMEAWLGTVPEPSAVLAASVAGLLFCRRRR